MDSKKSIVPPTNAAVVMNRSRLSVVHLSVCPVRALTFESPDLETSFLVRRCIISISREGQWVMVKVTEAKNGIDEHN